KAAARSERVVSVRHNGREILSTEVAPAAHDANGDTPNNFTFAAWIKPADATTLVPETNRGVVGMSEKRNDALVAPHGDGFGGSGHAGCGLSIGTNGVCVFEHGANYFAPTLVHAAPLTNWTHVTVVYREGQPSLYLNGAMARTGLKSDYIVHCAATAGAHAQFRGKIGSFTQLGRASSDSEAAQLASTMPRPDLAFGGPALQLTRIGRELGAVATEPGDYEVMFADGTRRPLRVAAVSEPEQVLTGPWEVQFDPAWGAPERATFDSLSDWTHRSEDGIRHYSGQATYRKTFELPASRFAEGASHFVLDLGEVRDLATVRLNGKDLGTLWMAPWRLDITGAVKPGPNTLEIQVINTWNNRLVGDAALPAAARHTVLLAPTVQANTPLLPAGLLGPVRILQTRLPTE
ncbi:MAG TPA: hypothetical protein P5534_15265, partial [Candidatus Paceibacterota bacterium]|nr:hypothetical protein [Candidatus Paceibacterota bacterium]